MKQKKIWMCFLIIGLISSMIFSSCGKEDVEYKMTVDLIYVNTTDSLVHFSILEDIGSNEITEVKLYPYTTSKIFSYTYEGVEKIVDPQSCCNDFLRNVYASSDNNGLSKHITLNDTLCITQLNEKSCLIQNYSHEIIADRHFQYTYTFNEQDFTNAKLCEEVVSLIE